jgi:hypothetical protein
MSQASATPDDVRWALEVLERQPAEEAYAGLLRYLAQAGMLARLEGGRHTEAKIAVAYKLAVELGGKLILLDDSELATRRQLAAKLFGEGRSSDGWHTVREDDS